MRASERGECLQSGGPVALPARATPVAMLRPGRGAARMSGGAGRERQQGLLGEVGVPACEPDRARGGRGGEERASRKGCPGCRGGEPSCRARGGRESEGRARGYPACPVRLPISGCSLQGGLRPECVCARGAGWGGGRGGWGGEEEGGEARVLLPPAFPPAPSSSSPRGCRSCRRRLVGCRGASVRGGGGCRCCCCSACRAVAPPPPLRL